MRWDLMRSRQHALYERPQGIIITTDAPTFRFAQETCSYVYHRTGRVLGEMKTVRMKNTDIDDSSFVTSYKLRAVQVWRSWCVRSGTKSAQLLQRSRGSQDLTDATDSPSFDKQNKWKEDLHQIRVMLYDWGDHCLCSGRQRSCILLHKTPLIATLHKSWHCGSSITN